MNITLINSKRKIMQRQYITFKSNEKSQNTTQSMQDEFVPNKNNKNQKKNVWTSIAIGALVLALIADVIVEHKLRIEKKTREEERKIADKLKKELEEKTKKLEEEIKKQKEQIEKVENSGKSRNDTFPNIDIKPPKS